MFIKIWQLITLYIDRMDWRAGHLTTTEGTGGEAFANKKCPQVRAFEQFFQMPRYARVFVRGGYSRPELACTLVLYVRLIGTINAPINGKSRRGYGQGTGI